MNGMYHGFNTRHDQQREKVTHDQILDRKQDGPITKNNKTQIKGGDAKGLLMHFPM